MECFVNKQKVSYDQRTTLYEVIRDFDYHNRQGVAVAVNNEVVPQSQWEQQSINDQDRITVIRATQGG